jgi:hypothetical protein
VKGGLLRDVAEIYLQNIPAFPIEPLPNHEFYVSRKFLLDAFGASNQQFLANFKPIHIHNIDERRAAVFPQPTLNPFLPRTPGAAGLIFASRLEITIDRDPEPPWALFCRDNPSGAAVWRYMGDYRNRRCGSLTAEQFASQTPGVCYWIHFFRCSV